MGGTAPEIVSTLGRSLLVSGLATLLALAIGLPLGVVLGSRAFAGRRVALGLVHTGMGLPTVLVGLAGILLLGREGPLGGLGLLYTPAAMVLAQAVIAVPVVLVLTISAVQMLDRRVILQIRAMGSNRLQEMLALAQHARLGLLAAAMAAFGTALSEVGAALMVGGNLRGSTRVLTTATLLEARRGHFDLAIQLAVLLLVLTLLVNGTLTWLQQRRSAAPDEDVTRIATDARALREEGLAVQVRELRKDYGSRRVVDVDGLDVRCGETLAIVGPNGAGKSTLLRMLGLLERPTRGTVAVGTDVNASVLERRRALSFVSQDPPMLAGTALSNIEAPLRVRGVGAPDRRARAAQWLERLGISHVAQTAAADLSGGERRRVALARALVTDPQVLFLDEPFVSLDPPTRDSFVELVGGVVREDRRTTVLVTQERDEALRLADRLAVMWEGRVLQVGATLEVLSRPDRPDVARFLGTDTVLAGETLGSQDGVTKVQVGDQTIQAEGSFPSGTTVWVCIRPENVEIRQTGSPTTTTARNVWVGEVREVTLRGLHRRVVLDVGFPLAASVTTPSVTDLDLKPGSRVEALVKATAVHVIAGAG